MKSSHAKMLCTSAPSWLNWNRNDRRILKRINRQSAIGNRQYVAGTAGARRRLGLREGRRRKRRRRDLFWPRKIQCANAGAELHRGGFAKADGISAPARRARLRHAQHARF